MKYINFFISFLFILFALLQYNDPDGLTWILIYGVLSILAGFAGAGKHFRDFSLGMLLLLIGMTLIHIPYAWEFFFNQDGVQFVDGMSNEFSYIEGMRECGGLAIASISMYFVFRSGKKARN